MKGSVRPSPSLRAPSPRGRGEGPARSARVRGATRDYSSTTSTTRRFSARPLRRADEVRRYLSRSAQLPLNRMSTISYGDTLPVASNKTRKGRAETRRVVLVVLE